MLIYSISNVNINPSIEGGSTFTISANILYDKLPSFYEFELWQLLVGYSNTLSMNINANGNYECQIPPQPYNTMFCYSITATICDEVSHVLWF